MLEGHVFSDQTSRPYNMLSKHYVSYLKHVFIPSQFFPRSFYLYLTAWTINLLLLFVQLCFGKQKVHIHRRMSETPPVLPQWRRLAFTFRTPFTRLSFFKHSPDVEFYSHSLICSTTLTATSASFRRDTFLLACHSSSNFNPSAFTFQN